MSCGLASRTAGGGRVQVLPPEQEPQKGNKDVCKSADPDVTDQSILITSFLEVQMDSVALIFKVFDVSVLMDH